jgi:glutamyl/glutaminyl-tRNA synthetase
MDPGDQCHRDPVQADVVCDHDLRPVIGRIRSDMDDSVSQSAPAASSPVVTRFAPSPTGHLHVGGARTALFCWALAKRLGGRFLLRVEDTDRKRSSEAAAEGILRDLAWLGIGWDDGPELEAGPEHGGLMLGGDSRGVGPYLQSQRAEIYHRVFDTMLSSGLAYPAFESEDELTAMRDAAVEAKETFRYRRGHDYDHDRALERIAAGEPHVLRFNMPTDPVTVRDEVLGDIEFTEDHTDDFVIRKRDGMPTYHLAVVVDDELMGVTHVVRGQEHLQNTPRHVALQQALGYRVPVYAHLPLIFNPDGSKMSKRDKDKAARAACKGAKLSEPPTDAISGERFAAWMKDKKSQLESGELLALADTLTLDLPEIEVEDFRRSGYLPAALCNYLALLGWNPGEKTEDGKNLERFDQAFLAEKFGLERVGKSPSKFDRDKLLAFNQDAVAAMDSAEFESAWRAWLSEFEPEALERLGERFGVLAQAVQPRAKTFRQALEPAAFAIVEDDAYAFDDNAVAKALHKGEPTGLAVLGDLRKMLEGLSEFSVASIESAIQSFCEQREMGMGKAAQPLRVAVTGNTVSPGLGETLASLGRDSVLARIDRCLSECAQGAGA